MLTNIETDKIPGSFLVVDWSKFVRGLKVFKFQVHKMVVKA